MPATPPSASKADLKRTRKQRAREAMAARERGNEVPTAVQPEDETPLVAFERPSPLKQIAVMDFVVGGAEAVVAAATLTGHIGGATEDAVWMGLHALVLLVAAVGLWTLRPFGRYAQFAMAAAALVSGSIAMIAAIPIGIYVARPGMALLVSGREPRTLDARQRARIRQDTASPLLIPAAVGFYTLLAVTRLWSPLGALFSR